MPTSRWVIAYAVGLVVSACGNSVAGSGVVADGGAPGRAGSAGTSGSNESAGANSKGGASAQGGASAEGGSNPSSGAGGASNGGAGGAGGDLCGRKFDALVQCGIIASSATELARERVRFQTSCTATLALPGTGDTTSSVNACITALEASSCDPSAPPAECQKPRGKLQTDARCNDDVQCQSGVCDLGQKIVNAALDIPSCGKCVSPVPEGQPCDGSSICAAGTSCNYSLAPDRVCQAFGAVGASCGQLFPPCRDGLFCKLTSEGAKDGLCVKPVGEGVACAETICLPGLLCSPITKNCGRPVGWAKAGETCNSRLKCEAGWCLGEGSAGSTCSAIDPDGQGCSVTDPYPKSSCDSSTSCVDGQCTLTNTVACPSQ